MKKINFKFINDKGQEKNGYAWVDEKTIEMLQKISETERINYLREIYYEQIKEQKYRRRISSLDEICSSKQKDDGDEVAFEFPDNLNIEENIINERVLIDVASNFNDEEKEIIREVLIKKVSATEFGRRKGQTQQNISKKIKKIKEKLDKINYF